MIKKLIFIALLLFTGLIQAQGIRQDQVRGLPQALDSLRLRLGYPVPPIGSNFLYGSSNLGNVFWMTRDGVKDSLNLGFEDLSEVQEYEPIIQNGDALIYLDGVWSIRNLYTMIDTLGGGAVLPDSVVWPYELGIIINDSLDDYLQVGDWETIEDPIMLSTDRLLYQPDGVLAISSAKIEDILALGIDSSAISSLVGDSLRSASNIIPKGGGYAIGDSTHRYSRIYTDALFTGLNFEQWGYQSIAVGSMNYETFTFRSGSGGVGGIVKFDGYTRFYKNPPPNKLEDHGQLWAGNNGEMYVMNDDSLVIRLTKIQTEYHPFLNMAAGDTAGFNHYDYATTYDSIKYWLPLNDTVRIQIQHGEVGSWTNLFASATELVGEGNLTSFNDNTITANKRARIYFTYVSGSSTGFDLKVYKRD